MNEGFRLTPIDVRTQEFQRATFGYDRAGVEDFRERVAAELEQLLKDRAVLEERLQNAREQLKALREREKAINEAVMMAQELREGAQRAAQHEAELVVRDARGQADEILRETRECEAQAQRDLQEAQHQFTAYLTAFRRLLDYHQAAVDALERHERDGSPPDVE